MHSALINIVSLVFPALVAAAVAPNVLLAVIICNFFVIIAANFLANWLGIGQYASGLIPINVLILSIFSIFSYASSIATGSELYPYIPGGDAEQYYSIAVKYANSSGSYLDMAINYRGYPLILSYLFRVFGISLFTGLCFNYALSVLGSLLISAFSYRACDRVDVGRYTLIACMLSPHILAQSIILQKDIVLFFAFALFAYGIQSIRASRGSSTGGYVACITSLLVVGVTRLPFVVFLALGGLFFILSNERKAKSPLAMRLVFILLVLLVVILAMPVLKGFTSHEINSEFVSKKVFQKGSLNAAIDQNSSSSGVVRNLGFFYTGSSTPVRAVLVPVPLFIQYSLPGRVFSTAFLSNHSWYFVKDNLHGVWLFFLGPLALYSIYSRARIESDGIRQLLVFGVVGYASIAFIYAGLVPRYATPTFAFIFPAVGLVWANACRFPHELMRLKRFFGYYFLLALLGLCAYVASKLI